jgi:heme O synthase-like polyprenyltransferase
MSEPSTDRNAPRDRRLQVVAVVLGVAVLLYSVLVVQQILAAVALLLWVFVVYLAWRFVRAHERLAGAAERIAAREEPTRPVAPDEDAAVGDDDSPEE